jgi:hypothetical protein
MCDRAYPALAIRRAERVQLLGQCRSQCGRPGIQNGRPLLPPQVSAVESSWVIGINQVIGSVISGCAVSCGAVIALAGASKLYRGIRGLDDMTAIRRALRMPRRQWRLFGLTTGGTECVVGAVVCSGAHPALRRRPDRPRGGVLRSAGVCPRQARSWRLRVYQVAHRDRNCGRSANLAGNGSQRNAARRRRRVHGGLSWCSQLHLASTGSVAGLWPGLLSWCC